MNEPVTHQPINDFGAEIHNNLQGLGKLTNTKELTIHLRRPKPIDCEYSFLSCILGCFLVYLLNVQHALMDFLKFSNLHGLITSCTFIIFWKFSSQLDFFTIDF